MKRLLFTYFFILIMLSACAMGAPAGPRIHIENAWARPTIGSTIGTESATPQMPGMSAGDVTSTAYFVIVNDGGEADTLINASSNVAKGAEMHETQIKDNIAEMVPVPRLDVPTGGRIEFKPGSYHVMLTGLTQDLKVGQTIKLTLYFEKSGAIVLDVPILQEP